jgi:hypothetical protein
VTLDTPSCTTSNFVPYPMIFGLDIIDCPSMQVEISGLAWSPINEDIVITAYLTSTGSPVTYPASCFNGKRQVLALMDSSSKWWTCFILNRSCEVGEDRTQGWCTQPQCHRNHSEPDILPLRDSCWSSDHSHSLPFCDLLNCGLKFDLRYWPPSS